MILIGFGSNQTFNALPPSKIIEGALRALNEIVNIVAVSRFYTSPAWPDPKDPEFVNAVGEIETALSPEALLGALHALEAGFGRRRSARNAPRTLDIDLLAYGDRVSGPGALELPHPRMARRGFVLAPLCDIAPEWRSPLTGETAAAALARLDKIDAAPRPDSPPVRFFRRTALATDDRRP